MTIKEAIEAAIEGKKVTCDSFSDEEYFTTSSNGVFVEEKGYHFQVWIDEQSHKKVYADGWRIWKPKGVEHLKQVSNLEIGDKIKLGNLFHEIKSIDDDLPEKYRWIWCRYPQIGITASIYSYFQTISKT